LEENQQVNKTQDPKRKKYWDQICSWVFVKGNSEVGILKMFDSFLLYGLLMLIQRWNNLGFLEFYHLKGFVNMDLIMDFRWVMLAYFYRFIVNCWDRFKGNFLTVF
jgi:hypothetical protein